MSIHRNTDELVSFLNSLVAIDPWAIAELLCVRVPCNKSLADHPTVQVASGDAAATTFIAPGTFRVGILGILNGYCGTIDEGRLVGYGPISAVYNEGRLIKFEHSETAIASK